MRTRINPFTGDLDMVQDSAFGEDSVFFDSDPNTGFLRTSEDNIAFRTGGVNAVSIDATQNALFAADVTITGNLIVNGTTITQNVTTVEIQDNLLLINNGEQGTGVTAGAAGLEVDRGLAINYQFMFRESDNAFVIGEVGVLQSVATRQDAPTNAGIPFWNAASSRFDTNSTFVYNGTSVGVGTDTPLAILHVLGNLRLSQNETDSTTKSTAIVGSQYLSSSEPEGYSVIINQAISGSNLIALGGGFSSLNAATDIKFYTAATLAHGQEHSAWS